MRKLKLNELKSIILKEGKHALQTPYPDGRVHQVREHIKQIVGKDVRFATHMLLATLVDMVFQKLHTTRDKETHEYWQEIYVQTKELLEFVKNNEPR